MSLSPDTPIIVIELFLVAGGALAFGWWQLRDLKKERLKTAEREKLVVHKQAQDRASSKESSD